MMETLNPPLVNTTVAAACLAVAAVTDVRSRRIPNVLTFPAVVVGVLLWGYSRGLFGLLLGVTGAFAAPLALLVLRAFRPLGMGDIKLAAAVGALAGPAAGALAMLVSTLAGGVVAILCLLRPGTQTARLLGPFLHGFPILGRLYRAAPSTGKPDGIVTVPYGVAIALGSMLTLGYLGWM